MVFHANSLAVGTFHRNKQMITFETTNCLCDSSDYGDNTGMTALFEELGMQPSDDNTYFFKSEAFVLPELTKVG